MKAVFGIDSFLFYVSFLRKQGSIINIVRKWIIAFRYFAQKQMVRSILALEIA